MSDDPFTLLGIDPGFDLDRAAIDRAYRARAASIHPDLADPETAADAAGASARLNDARATLADPERRANALLAVLGGPAASDDRSLPDGFLMEMMDVRQRAEAECVTKEGHAEWDRWAAERRDASISDVSELFELALSEGPGSPTLSEIRQVLNAWRYIERMIEQLDPDHADPM
ncbi:MAG: DnaJ domain-containing protein [Phycisphaerales bacterium]